MPELPPELPLDVLPELPVLLLEPLLEVLLEPVPEPLLDVPLEPVPEPLLELVPESVADGPPEPELDPFPADASGPLQPSSVLEHPKGIASAMADKAAMMAILIWRPIEGSSYATING